MIWLYTYSVIINNFFHALNVIVLSNHIWQYILQNNMSNIPSYNFRFWAKQNMYVLYLNDLFFFSVTLEFSIMTSWMHPNFAFIKQRKKGDFKNWSFFIFTTQNFDVRKQSPLIPCIHSNYDFLELFLESIFLVYFHSKLRVFFIGYVPIYFFNDNHYYIF